jgi:DNA polymerase-3 subunit delta
MPKLTVTQLDQELRGGKIRPLYVIVGPEAYLARTATRCIADTVLGSEASPDSKQVYSGGEVKTEALIDSLRATSLFSGHTLVIVRDGDKLRKEVLTALASYVESPSEASTLVIEASKIDGRNKFMKSADKHAAVVECKTLYANQIPSWINMEVARYEKRIARDAAQFLADMVGNDLGQLSQALERVSLYVGKRPLIELKDVEEAVTETAQRTVFELGDAIGARKTDRALAVLNNLLESGQAPVFVLNMIARHIRLLTKAREVAGRMQNPQDLARYLGVHPFFAQNYASQARNFSAKELRSFFSALSQCDRQLKSSRLPRERILEKLIFELCGK